MTSIDITAVVKIKHADLYKAAKKLGGQKALADYLGVTQQVLGYWCNLKACPPTSIEQVHPPSKWTADNIRELEVKLYKLTGKLLIELFPPELSQAERFLKSNKTQEITRSVEIDGLLEYAEATAVRLSAPSPLDGPQLNELKDDLRKVVKTLRKSQQHVLTMRYGLDGNMPATLLEVGKVLGVSVTRVRQIEIRALDDIKDQVPRLSEHIRP